MDRNAWLLAFTGELERLRPHLSLKVAWTLGLSLMKPGLDPVEAARQYHAQQPPVKRGRKGK